ncbi:hypothetical protein TK5_16590 [Sideroxyarcus sp. TK5]
MGQAENAVVDEAFGVVLIYSEKCGHGTLHSLVILITTAWCELAAGFAGYTVMDTAQLALKQ